MQFFYRILYTPFVNSILLAINRLIAPLTSLRIFPSGTIAVKTTDNLRFKMATNQTSNITRVIYWSGAEGFEYTPVFKHLIKNCRVFIDIGANSGYYSLLAAKANPSITVHAFEPAHGPLHYLKKNVALNQVEKQVTVHDTALSAEPGEMNFYEVKNKKFTYLPYNLSGVGSLQEDAGKKPYRVSVSTLDIFVKENNITAVDIIKIDTEGTENFILEGAVKTIETHRPIVVCETLFQNIEDKLEAIMRSHGYLFFNYNHKGKLEQVSTIIRATDDEVRDCFFVHPSKVDLIREFVVKWL